MERAEAEAIYDAGREVVVEVLLAMDRRIQQLEARVEKLECELRKDSRNSSAPPSSDPPGKRRAPRGRDSSGRKQGAQDGHEGHGRELLPASAVDRIIEHWPERCGCGHRFAPGELVAVGEPQRHQVEELPVISTVVIEHRAQRVRCPGCGERARAVLPVDVVRSAFGPRLQAAVAVLSVRNRVSRRDAAELLEELFGARICAGSIDAILARAAQALADPYEELLAHVRASESVNMDETGWRLKGAQRALWGMFTDRHAVFHVAPDRHEDHAKRLLFGHDGIVTSDRWWVYDHLPLKRRQICWSHLRRDFKAHAEGLASERDFGLLGLELSERVFWAWEVFQNTHERSELKRTIAALQHKFKPLIAQYAAKSPRHKYCYRMARNLLKLWPALWTFAASKGVEPTNNHAERSLRGAVIYRKLSLGSQSELGEQRIERLLSASVSCRLQHRSLFAYLSELLAAHARGDPVPSLT
ncbi:MAG: IS66 family transposase [Solirubrobacteraceae bacterium]